MNQEHDPYTLNDDQKNAADEVFQFLLGDEKEMILSGPAGVGKTHLMNYISDKVMDQYRKSCKLTGIPQKIDHIALTATTNKAAEVLARSTGRPVATVHSFLNLKVFDDFKTGQSKIKMTLKWEVHEGVLLFIDEASMIDTALHNYILTGTDVNSKIVYVGDHNQMAPVFEKISPVYMGTKRMSQLLTPVRNADQPALMDLCSQLRQTVETGMFNPIQEVPGVIDYIGDSDLKYLLENQFKDENVPGRILCYTNRRVLQYNDYIRGVRGYPDEFVTGEIVINNSVVAPRGSVMMKVEEEYEIRNINPNTETVYLDAGDNNAKIEVFNMVLCNTDPSKTGEIKVKSPRDKAHFTALLDFYKSRKNWERFYYLKNNFPDLRMKDACTVYKAQGSTHDFVVMDLTNIGSCRQADQVARMLYVGASRPKKRLFLYGELPDKFKQGFAK